jgi:hypothetical protein
MSRGRRQDFMMQSHRTKCLGQASSFAFLLAVLLASSCDEYSPAKRQAGSAGAQAFGGSPAAMLSEVVPDPALGGSSAGSGGDATSGVSSSDAGRPGAAGATGSEMAGSAGAGAALAYTSNNSAGTTNGGAAFGTGGAKATGAAGKSSFHVFLLLGQSNMAGYPKALPEDRTEEPRIKVLGYDSCSATGRQPDKWATAVPPLHECWNGAIGPGDYFAKTLLAALPAGDTIGLVPCAISGEKIETFMKTTGTKYDWIVSRAKLAQQAGGAIEGILFHQGESNNGESTWPGKVKTLVTDLKTDLGLSDIPFLAGELLYTGSCAGHNTLINQLPGVVPNSYVISANGLLVDPADTQWNLHFGHEAQVTLGKRYAAKMIEVLKL